jgi:5-methylcytosine-specific restriction endonuclease McrA
MGYYKPCNQFSSENFNCSCKECHNSQNKKTNKQKGKQIIRPKENETNKH